MLPSAALLHPNPTPLVLSEQPVFRQLLGQLARQDHMTVFARLVKVFLRILDALRDVSVRHYFVLCSSNDAVGCDRIGAGMGGNGWVEVGEWEGQR